MTVQQIKRLEKHTSDRHVVVRIKSQATKLITWRLSLPSGNTLKAKALCYSSQDNSSRVKLIGWRAADSTSRPNLFKSPSEDLMTRLELRGVSNKDFQLPEKEIKVHLMPKYIIFRQNASLYLFQTHSTFLPFYQMLKIKRPLIWELFDLTFAVLYTMLYLPLTSAADMNFEKSGQRSNP